MLEPILDRGSDGDVRAGFAIGPGLNAGQQLVTLGVRLGLLL